MYRLATGEVVLAGHEVSDIAGASETCFVFVAILTMWSKTCVPSQIVGDAIISAVLRMGEKRVCAKVLRSVSTIDGSRWGHTDPGHHS